MPYQPGTRFESYEVLELLQQGAWGELYRVVDLHLNREATLRLGPVSHVHDMAARSRALERFGKLGAVDHPNVVRVFAFGVHEGRPFIVSELPAGSPLAERLRRGPISRRQALSFAAQIARGLAALHEHGLVHGHLDPSHVFVSYGDILKIADFSLGELLGLPTLGYVAPEVLRGNQGDQKSDIFSLGTIVYELLSGRRAFDGTDSVEIAIATISQDPVPLTDLVHDAPRAVVELLMRTLEKQPLARLQRAIDVAFVLESAAFPSVESPAASRDVAVSYSLPQVLPYSAPQWLVWIPLAFVVVVFEMVVIRSIPSPPPDRAPAGYEAAATPLVDLPPFAIRSLSVPTVLGPTLGPLDVTVTPVSSCEPPCPITFAARVVNPAQRVLSYEWSGCADGSSSTALCTVNGSESVEATVSVRDATTGESVRASAKATSRTVTVFYATDRNPRRAGGIVDYSGARNVSDSDPLHFGVCTVTIPPGHLTGSIERPFQFWKVKTREDPSRHITLLEGTERTEAGFFADLHDHVNRSDRQDVLIFVHGFRVDFASALRRTGQLAWDLRLTGAPILYSWPSEGELAAYDADHESAIWTEPHLARFLRSVVDRSGAATVYVVAHSMGTWAVANALNVLSTESQAPGAPRLKELVLAAPDIDADIFIQRAPIMKLTAQHITLYAASQDRALHASRQLHFGNPRAGEAGEHLLVIKGVDTIDASNVVIEDTDILDHSYFGDVRTVLGDLYTLLRHGDPPTERFGLETRHKSSLEYWAFTSSTLPWLVFGVVVCLGTLVVTKLFFVTLSRWRRLGRV